MKLLVLRANIPCTAVRISEIQVEHMQYIHNESDNIIQIDSCLGSHSTILKSLILKYPLPVVGRFAWPIVTSEKSRYFPMLDAPCCFAETSINVAQARKKMVDRF